MPRPARSDPKPERRVAPPVVQNERLERRMTMAGDVTKPIRTVIYVEVGQLSPKEVNFALSQINAAYASNQHPTFVIPLRGGKAYTDVLFEGEILEMIKGICEVRDGQIVLKREPVDMDVVRIQV